MKGVTSMDISELQSKFIQCKNYSTDNVNELLDFARKSYIYNEININEYRNLIRELEDRGAMIPDSEQDSNLIQRL